MNEKIITFDHKSGQNVVRDNSEEEVMIIGEKVVKHSPNEDVNQWQRQTNANKWGSHSLYNKTSVQTLNEMFNNNTSYVEEGRMGPAHDPLFRIGVHVNGMTFHGMSRTKQKARHEAAKQAIDFFTGRAPVVPLMTPMDRSYGMPVHSRYEPYYRYRRPHSDHNLESRQHFGHQMDSNEDKYYYYNSYYDYNHRNNHFNHTGAHYRDTSQTPSPSAVTPSPDINSCPISSSEITGPLSPSLPASAPISVFTTSSDDFTVDDYTDDAFVEFNDTFDTNSAIDVFEDMKTDDTTEQMSDQRKERIILRVMSETPVNQNPVSVINELQPNSKWVCTQLNTSNKVHSTTFQMRLLLPLANECFIGTARTKKLAKAEAASKALLQMYNISLDSHNFDTNSYKSKTTVQIAQEPLILKQDIANKIGREVLIKCSQVWDKLELKKWTVLSAIVLTDETNVDFVDVICLTSGTKCVKGDSLSMKGYALNDCHAEVLSRRAFVHFIYSQIEQLIDNNFEDKPQFIVERRVDGNGFRIKSSIKVHLFISTAPCGDSRVFSPKEEEESDAHPNRQTRGLLRAKIEGGEGTIPVKREAILTWDGVLQGQQRLQFMSCSDKIAVWNVVGLQGALLSHLMEPIYLEGVVLASLFSYEHLVRALHSRLDLNFDSNSLKSLPQHFRVNKSKVAKCQLNEDITRQITKAPNYALNWIKGDERPEVISTESGRIHSENIISRLAKRSLFGRFCALLGRNAPTLTTSALGNNIPVIYRDGKTSSLDYQRAKTQCMQTFQEQNLGNWIQMPSEMDLFRL